MTTCNFRLPDGTECNGSCPDNSGENSDPRCFWHSQAIKQQPDLITRLEDYAVSHSAAGGSLNGLQLQKADLRGINLVRYGHHQGYSLNDSDFYRADLREAHLFSCDLSGSSLMKADLRQANLHCADLRNCNLLGVRLEGARLDNVRWGKHIRQEVLARQSRNPEKRRDLLEQAEEIYRNLRKVTEQAGLFESAGHFFEREMIMRRYQMPLISLKRFLSKIVDLFCGYGERPARVVLFSVLMILCFGTLYFFMGIIGDNTPVKWQPEQSFTENISAFMTCIYFSVVTFTTLGYGDITPTGFARALAATEAFIGSFTLALFVVVFVKKMTR